MKPLLKSIDDIISELREQKEQTPHISSAIGALNAARDNIQGELNRQPKASELAEPEDMRPPITGKPIAEKPAVPVK